MWWVSKLRKAEQSVGSMVEECGLGGSGRFEGIVCFKGNSFSVLFRMNTVAECGVDEGIQLRRGSFEEE